MIPCIDCVTFPVCNGVISPVIDFTQIGVIFKLYDRCSIMRGYLNISQETKNISELDIEFTELQIDYDRLENVHTYYKNFKGRDQCSNSS